MVSNWTRICDRLRGPPCGWRRAQAGHGRPGPFAALGRAVVHHPWLTILAGVVAAVAVIATPPGLPTTTNSLGASCRRATSRSGPRTCRTKRSRRPGTSPRRRPSSCSPGPAIISGLVLAVLAIGAFSYKPTFDLSSAGIPSTAESQTALKTLEEGLRPAPPTQPSCSCASPQAGHCPLRTWPRSARSSRRGRAQEPAAPGRARGRTRRHVRADRRHHRGVRRHPEGRQPRLRGRVPRRRRHHPAPWCWPNDP